MTRAELRTEARRLRGLGWTAPRIGAHLGIPESTIRNWTNGGNCEDCGQPLDGSKYPKPRWCPECYKTKHQSESQTIWTSALCIDAIRWWADTFGEPPAIADFDPWRCFNTIHDPERGRRAADLKARQLIPDFSTVIDRFGSWNAAMAAAGFAPRCNTGGCGNSTRMRSMRAKLGQQ